MSTETPPVETTTPAKRDWRADVRDTFAAIPHKPVFGVLLLAWVLLFALLGNPTQGYVRSPSLFGWLSYAYDMKEDDFHGYLVPFVVLGLLWWKRRELAEARKRVWWPALAFVAFGVALHVLGFLIQQNRISVVGFYVGVWGLVGVVWGPIVMGKTFFPVFLFAFCLPVASIDSLTLPLRKIATLLTVKLANMLSIDVLQSGTTFVDPITHHKSDVAPACSGLRSLTAIGALTVTYAFVFFTRPWKRVTLIAAAVPLVIAANVIRLSEIVVASEIARRQTIGRATGEELAQLIPKAAALQEKWTHYVHDSVWFNFPPYVLATIGILLVGRRLKDDREVDILDVGIPVGVSLGVFYVLDKIFHVTRENGLAGGPGPWVVAAPAIIVIAAMLFSSRNLLKQFTPRGVTIGLATLLVIASGAGAIAHRRINQRLTGPGVKLTNDVLQVVSGTNVVGTESNIVFLPLDLPGFESQPIPLTQIVKEWLPLDTTYGQRRYIAKDNFFVDTMVVLMGADRTSIHNPRYCLPAQNIQITADERDLIRIDQPTRYDLPVTKLRLAGKQRMNDGTTRDFSGLFVYWFVSDTKLSAEHGKRMWETSRDLIRTGVMERWAYVICMTFFEPGAEREAAAYARLKDFIRESVPQFQTTTGQPMELSQAAK